MEEMRRVLRVGGRALIYAWAKEQEKDSKASSYLKKNYAKSAENAAEQDVNAMKTELPIVLPVHQNRTEFKHDDLLVPWKIKSSNPSQAPNSSGEKPSEQTFHRFYHVFKEGELENLINSVSGVSILKSYYDQGNWCCIFQKV